MNKQVKSRILQHIPKELIAKLNNICNNNTLGDNNTKVRMIMSSLNEFDVDYLELGPGTNRLAVLIDGYVFKFALDSDGVDDNRAEFSLTKDLQPFVTRVYECNGIMCVSEYVTVMSKSDFNSNKDTIKKILSILAETYLIGDVGTVEKNYMNWGYRDDGSIVILDFAYIYSLYGSELICNRNLKSGDVCKGMIEYDSNFNKLRCPKCYQEYSFITIRARINKDLYREDIADAYEDSYKVTKALTIIKQSEVLTSKQKNKETNSERTGEEMSKTVENTNINADDAFDALRNSLKRNITGDVDEGVQDLSLNKSKSIDIEEFDDEYESEDPYTDDVTVSDTTVEITDVPTDDGSVKKCRVDSTHTVTMSTVKDDITDEPEAIKTVVDKEVTTHLYSVEDDDEIVTDSRVKENSLTSVITRTNDVKVIAPGVTYVGSDIDDTENYTPEEDDEYDYYEDEEPLGIYEKTISNAKAARDSEDDEY